VAVISVGSFVYDLVLVSIALHVFFKALYGFTTDTPHELFFRLSNDEEEGG